MFNKIGGARHWITLHKPSNGLYYMGELEIVNRAGCQWGVRSEKLEVDPALLFGGFNEGNDHRVSGQQGSNVI